MKTMRRSVVVGGVCGSDIGECSFGKVICGSDGVMACRGGVSPRGVETCDNADNDCDR